MKHCATAVLNSLISLFLRGVAIFRYWSGVNWTVSRFIANSKYGRDQQARQILHRASQHISPGSFWASVSQEVLLLTLSTVRYFAVLVHFDHPFLHATRPVISRTSRSALHVIQITSSGEDLIIILECGIQSRGESYACLGWKEAGSWWMVLALCLDIHDLRHYKENESALKEVSRNPKDSPACPDSVCWWSMWA